MDKTDAEIQDVRLKIGGKWYESMTLGSDDCGCCACDLQEVCGSNDNLYKFCTRICYNKYFKEKVNNNQD